MEGNKHREKIKKKTRKDKKRKQKKRKGEERRVGEVTMQGLVSSTLSPLPLFPLTQLTPHIIFIRGRVGAAGGRVEGAIGGAI